MLNRRTRRPALSAALAVLALGFTLGACTSVASPSPSPTAAAPTVAASPVPSASPEPTAASPAPAPTASAVAGIPLCSPSKLAARIIAWDSGAGHRTARVEVTNTASSTCHIRTLDQPQLVDGHGSVIMNGPVPASSPFITMTPGSVLKTLVDAANYCGPVPVAPVTVAFIYPGGVGRFVATPLSPTDTTGVPPCFGTQAGDLGMLPWGP